MANLTFEMLTSYNRTQLQDIIRNNNIKCPKLSRLKHEDLIGIILENQERITVLPEVAEVKVRRGRRPQYSAEHKAIMSKPYVSEVEADKEHTTVAEENAEVVYPEPVLPQTKESQPEPYSAAPSVDNKYASKPPRRERGKQRQQYTVRQRDLYNSRPADSEVNEVEDSIEEEVRQPARLRQSPSIPRISIERQADLRRKNRLPQPDMRRNLEAENDYDDLEDDSYTQQRQVKNSYMDDTRYGRRELSNMYEPRRVSYNNDNNYSRYDNTYYEDYDSDDQYDDFIAEHEEYVPIVTGILDIRQQKNKTMSAVLLAPVSWAEILGGKIASGFILASLSTILVAAVSCVVKASFLPLIVLICLGSLIFAIGGIILGASVKSQSACGALNSLIYLVLIMPVTMADYNALMQKIAYFLPTWYLYDGFCKLIFTSGTWANIMPNVTYLFIELTIFAAVGIVAIKKVRLTV